MRHLRSFLAMAEERSSARAAHRLGITRQSVTQHVLAVEKSVGRKLLETSWPREPRQVGRTQLTGAGRAFFPKAVRAMRAHDELFEDRTSDEIRHETRLAILRDLLELALDTAQNNSPGSNRETPGNPMRDGERIRAAIPAEKPRRSMILSD